jgi:L-ribulose-5-phosphate 4-epimerase
MAMFLTRIRRPVDPVASLRDELVSVSRSVYDRNLSIGICGNASVRVPGTDLILIKRAGACMGHMTVDDVVTVSLDGRVASGYPAPSKETAWHLGIYRLRREVGAIIHAHPPHATAWAVANRVPPAVHAAARELLGPIRMVDLAPPGSARLAALVTDAFAQRDTSVALLREHGIVAAGADLRAAYYLTEHLEDTAQVAALARGIQQQQGGALVAADAAHG